MPVRKPVPWKRYRIAACVALGAALAAGTASAQTAQIPPRSIDDLLQRDAAPEPEPQTEPAPAPQAGEVITIVLAGDTGFSRNHSPVHPKGVLKYGRRQPFAEALSAIKQEIDGDLNFVNIETVVTDRNDLRRDTKGQRGPFNFRSHPNSMRALTEAGFNLFSLANNHSMDYGPAGLRDTLRHVEALSGDGLLAHAGVGENRDAAGRPYVLDVKGARIGFAAIGIVTNNLARHRAGPDKPGQIAYRFDEDFDESTRRLAETTSDYRLLSIHYGIEGRVRADARQIKDWRRLAARQRGIDLIVGHHAHVVRGVEVTGDAIIFYGLGNFLHHGTADMGKKGICKDYGLLARVHLLRGADGKLQPGAIEATPVTKMHIRTEPVRPAARSHARLHALNYLARTLDSEADGARGVRFTPQPDGSGLYCFDRAKEAPGALGTLCRDWRPAGAIPSRLRGAIAASCRS